MSHRSTQREWDCADAEFSRPREAMRRHTGIDFSTAKRVAAGYLTALRRVLFVAGIAARRSVARFVGAPIEAL